MKMKGFLSVGMVSVLAVACAWTSAEPSGTAGFTVIPDNEAAQIVGGSGRVCDLGNPIYPPFFLPCCNDANDTDCLYGRWCYQMARYKCADAESGECYDEYYLPYQEYGDCGWYPEYGGCVATSVDFKYDWFCQ